MAKLAEALLRRKELQQKVDQLFNIQQKALVEVVVDRRKAHENIDDIIAKVPKLTASQVTAEYDFYASQLRKIDALIQKANWTLDVPEVDAMNLMAPYRAPEDK